MVNSSLLLDAVTLRHFAAAESLDVCEELYGSSTTPNWTLEVSEEIAKGVRLHVDDCISVQECAWLGAPYEPEIIDLEGIYRLRIALGDRKRNAGEAEGIYFADMLDARFVTDDAVAHDFAARRLGHHRVLDTIDVLHEGVAADVVSPTEAAETVTRITDAGRFLRPGRPVSPGHTFFEK